MNRAAETARLVLLDFGAHPELTLVSQPNPGGTAGSGPNCTFQHLKQTSFSPAKEPGLICLQGGLCHVCSISKHVLQ